MYVYVQYLYVESLIEISIHKPCPCTAIAAVVVACGLEPATIEKYVERGHVTHVESNGSGDVNKPDRLWQPKQHKMCPGCIFFLRKSERFVH